jgi:Sel1 repeat
VAKLFVPILVCGHVSAVEATPPQASHAATSPRCFFTKPVTDATAFDCGKCDWPAAVPVTAGPFEDAVAAHGRGDYATALRLWRPLADQGNAHAQFNLGAMYANGQGVPQDYVRAHMWFNLSAAQGNQGAAKNRDIAARRMTPAQIAKAQKLTHK